MDLSFYEFVGDGLGNDDVVDTTKTYLSNKYNKEFTVQRIGNRYGSDEDDVATLYCTPKDINDFVFSVKYDLDKEECKDNFLYRKVCYELESKINEILKESNISAITRTDIIKKNTLDEDISLKDFIEKYTACNFLTYVILDDNAKSNLVKEAYKKILNEYPDIKINSYIYTAEKDEFENAKNTISDFAYFSKSIIGRYVKKEPKIYRVIDKEIIEVK